MAIAKTNSRAAGRELSELLTRDRIKRIDASKSTDPDLEQLRAVVRKAKLIGKRSNSALLEKASKYLS